MLQPIRAWLYFHGNTYWVCLYPEVEFSMTGRHKDAGVGMGVIRDTGLELDVTVVLHGPGQTKVLKERH